MEGDTQRSTNGHAFARAGQSVRITCTCIGGQPQPDLTLFRNGLPVPGVHSRKKENSFTFAVRREDNHAIWQCGAVNPLATVNSNEIVLNVLCEYFWWEKVIIHETFCELTYSTRLQLYFYRMNSFADHADGFFELALRNIINLSTKSR